MKYHTIVVNHEALLFMNDVMRYSGDAIPSPNKEWGFLFNDRLIRRGKDN